MATSKIYINQDVFNKINEQIPSSQGVDISKPCINSITPSGNQITIYFKNSDGTRYYNTTLVYPSFADGWYFTKVSWSSSMPSTCFNSTQTNFTPSNNFDSVEITHDFVYHPNFDGILVIFFIIVLIFIYFPYRIISRAFGRWLKV